LKKIDSGTFGSFYGLMNKPTIQTVAASPWRGAAASVPAQAATVAECHHRLPDHTAGNRLLSGLCIRNPPCYMNGDYEERSTSAIGYKETLTVLPDV